MKKLCFILTLFLIRTASVAQYSWNNVGSGMNSPVYTLAADTTNDILYAGGIFTLSGLTPVINVAKWNGTSWTPIGGGIISGVGISSLLVDGTDVIAGGSFTNIGGVLSKNIAKWDGTSWLPIGAGLEITGITSVNALAIYNGDLYAGGVFALSGSTLVSNIARWDGTAWQPLTSGTNGPVKSLCVYGTDLYVGGSFTSAGGIPVNNIAKWDGSAWSDVGGGMSYTGATTVSTLTVFTGDLYAGGTFTTAGAASVKHIAKWDGFTWSDVGGGAGSYTGATTVSTLTIFGGELIAGGSMDSLGSTPVNNIGKWDGSVWTPLGSGTGSAVNTLTSMHDTLYAGGLFLTAGGAAAPFVAEWIPGSSTLSTTSEELNAGQGTLALYPNPAEELHIRPNDPKNSHSYHLVISDISGREILNKEFSRETVISSGQIPAGLYLYKISSGKELVQAGKVVFR